MIPSYKDALCKQFERYTQNPDGTMQVLTRCDASHDFHVQWFVVAILVHSLIVTQKRGKVLGLARRGWRRCFDAFWGNARLFAIILLGFRGCLSHAAALTIALLVAIDA
jgi:hypothetical protein